MAEKTGTSVPIRREERGLRHLPRLDTPFGMMQRFADEMDRMWEDVGFGPSWLSRPGRWLTGTRADIWTPDVEIFHRGNELIVRADLPGLTKDDVKVDVTDDSVTIQGERHRETEEEREGLYRSERTYGSFCRVLTLPEGAITDQAKATFKNGVLEVTMPAPPEQVTRGRRLEITETGEPTKK